MPTLERSDAAEQRYVLRTAFHYAEAQGDEIDLVRRHRASIIWSCEGGRLALR